MCIYLFLYVKFSHCFKSEENFHFSIFFFFLIRTWSNYLLFSALTAGLSKEELSVLAVTDIIQELVKAHNEGKDVNLNKVKSHISSKYALDSSPRLVDIIAAVPPEYKKIIVPKLKAKPIRTASGVSQSLFFT